MFIFSFCLFGWRFIFKQVEVTLRNDEGEHDENAADNVEYVQAQADCQEEDEEEVVGHEIVVQEEGFEAVEEVVEMEHEIYEDGDIILDPVTIPEM